MEKLVVIGLDAADVEYIRSRLDALPTMRRLLHQGRVWEPESPRALSGSVWPTFSTAREPGDHGMYQHLVWDAGRMGLRRVAPDWCRLPAFWRELEQSGQRVVALDMPYTFPVNLQHGVEITDWGTHGQVHPFASNDPRVADYVRRRFGRSPIGRETPVAKSPAQLDRLYRRLKRSVRAKSELITDLMRELDWDVFVTVFAETHRAGHTLFRQADAEATAHETTPLLGIYRETDRALGRILDGIDGAHTRVLLFSVHGMMRDHNQGDLVRPVMAALNETFMTTHGLAPATSSRKRPWVGQLRGVVPSRVQHVAGELASDRVRQWVVEREIVGGLDWSRTPGFALRTDIRSELRLNLRGREAAGLLDRDGPMHRRYVGWLRSIFMDLRDSDTGERLVDEISDIPAMYPGEYSDALPDLVVNWRPVPPARRVHSPQLGDFHRGGADVRGGDHTDRGFAILVGDAAIPNDLPALSRISDFGGFVQSLAA